MKKTTTMYFLSALLLAIQFIPSFFIFLPEVLKRSHERVLLEFLLLSLFVLIILMIFSFSGTAQMKKRRGWKKPNRLDYIIIPLIVIFTLFLGIIFAPKHIEFIKPKGGRNIIYLFVLAWVSASIEELYFRSWLLAELAQAGWKNRWSILFSISIFAIFHQWQGWQGFVFSAIAATVYCLLFYWRRSLFPLICAHGIHNTVAFWSILEL